MNTQLRMTALDRLSRRNSDDVLGMIEACRRSLRRLPDGAMKLLLEHRVAEIAASGLVPEEGQRTSDD